MSHHSLTAYGRVALCEADIAVPDLAGDGSPAMAELASAVAARLDQMSRHRLIMVDLTGLRTVLAASPIRLSSMGRGLEADPGYSLPLPPAATPSRFLEANRTEDFDAGY